MFDLKPFTAFFEGVMVITYDALKEPTLADNTCIAMISFEDEKVKKAFEAKLKNITINLLGEIQEIFFLPYEASGILPPEEVAVWEDNYRALIQELSFEGDAEKRGALLQNIYAHATPGVSDSLRDWRERTFGGATVPLYIEKGLFMLRGHFPIHLFSSILSKIHQELKSEKTTQIFWCEEGYNYRLTAGMLQLTGNDLKVNLSNGSVLKAGLIARFGEEYVHEELTRGTLYDVFELLDQALANADIFIGKNEPTQKTIALPTDDFATREFTTRMDVYQALIDISASRNLAVGISDIVKLRESIKTLRGRFETMEDALRKTELATRLRVHRAAIAEMDDEVLAKTYSEELVKVKNLNDFYTLSDGLREVYDRYVEKKLS